MRVAAWPTAVGSVYAHGLIESGPTITLTRLGEILEVSAIIGTGPRTGVDMPCGSAAIYGHIGLDLTGPNGGVIRIDDIEIEDVTSAFHRTMIDWVDVRDFRGCG